MNNEKRPRQYAAEILAVPTLEGRRKALDAVPEKYREWVKHYLRLWWRTTKEERR